MLDTGPETQPDRLVPVFPLVQGTPLTILVLSNLTQEKDNRDSQERCRPLMLSPEDTTTHILSIDTLD